MLVRAGGTGSDGAELVGTGRTGDVPAVERRRQLEVTVSLSGPPQEHKDERFLFYQRFSWLKSISGGSKTVSTENPSAEETQLLW